MQFELADIALFINIADAGSLTRGAERSFVSVPAASMRIRNLEDKLGIKLLYRNNHGVTLTPAGLTFKLHGRKVMKQLEYLNGDLRAFGHGVKGHIRLFACTTVVAEYLPQVLEEYLTLNPNVTVEIREVLSADVAGGVRDGIADIGIILGDVPVEDLKLLPYRHDHAVLVAPETHPLARRDTVRFVDATDYEHIVPGEPSTTQRFLAQAAHAVHRPLKIRAPAPSNETLCRMVAAGIGVGVVPESVGRLHAASLPLRLIPITDRWAALNFQLCVRDVASLPTFAKDLVALLAGDPALAARRDHAVVRMKPGRNGRRAR